MHEYNICQTIVDTVLSSAEPGSRVVKVIVVIGRLRQLVPEYLKFAYGKLTEGTAAKGSLLEIRPSPAKFRCDRCGVTVESDEPCFRCASCGSERGLVVGGREMYVESIEVDG